MLINYITEIHKNGLRKARLNFICPVWCPGQNNRITSLLEYLSCLCYSFSDKA
jgi:hypothetical protein